VDEWGQACDSAILHGGSSLQAENGGIEDLTIHALVTSQPEGFPKKVAGGRIPIYREKTTGKLDSGIAPRRGAREFILE
jgi:hypothetical protein